MAPHAPRLPGLTFVADLGAGGYADVYAYASRLPARTIAVKVLRGAASGSASALVAEANALAALEHPSIVPVYGAGKTDDGRGYLAMMLCPLPSLAVRCRPSGLPVAEALDVSVRVAGALETAHRAGIVHADVKPANILTSRYGQPMLADFGIAGRLAADGALTPAYAAPELLAGADASPASDVYALAATCWTLLTGRPPLVQRSWAPPGATGRADVPPALEELLVHTLAPRDRRRCVSAAQWADEVRALQRRLGWPVSEFAVPRPGPGALGAPVTLARELLQ